jgi:hypothetical protein
MKLPVQDPFWTETAEFIVRAIGSDTPFVGPREFSPLLPKVFPYDWGSALETLHDYKGVAVHKGLMHELPVTLLRKIEQEWTCVFANAVFLFFLPPSSGLPLVSGEHLGAFYDNMISLEKLELERKSRFIETSSAVVVAKGAHAGLEATLRSLALLRLETAVVPVMDDANQREACRSLCERYRAHIVEKTGESVPAPDEALKVGVMMLLVGKRNAWIATFDDSTAARPDFLAVMEKWRDSQERPLLGGYWERADGVRESFHRDGFHLVVPRRLNTRHIYAHRDYWVRRFNLPEEPRAHTAREPGYFQALKALVIPGLIVPHGDFPGAGATTPPAC